MGSVFISYSSKDRDRVAVIADTLRAQGFEVWWDREIPVATTYQEHIKKQLEAAQAVVVVWSPASVASPYVMWEAQRAHRRGILVPALIEEADLPPEFFLIQAADLTRWRGITSDPEWKRLTGALARLVSHDAEERSAGSPSVEPPAPASRAAGPAPRPPRRAAGTSGSPRPWYARPLGLAALGGGALLAVVAALILMSGGAADPTTTVAGATTVVTTTTLPAATTTAPTTTTMLPPTTTQPAPAPDLAWSRIWSQDSAIYGGSGDQSMLALTAWGTGFVAVGDDSTSGNVGGAVWTSADGTEWIKVAGTEDVQGVMYGIAAGGPGLVAVGYHPGDLGARAAVWTSVDGVTWELVPDDPVFDGVDPRMHAVTAGGPGLVAVGEDGTLGAVWTSTNGVEWERVDAGFGANPMMSRLRGVVADPALGIVAVGAATRAGYWQAAVWISSDGAAWERVESDAFVGGPPSGEWINAITIGGPGLVAVGGTGGDAAVWTSPDGRAWTRVDDVDVLGGEGLEMFGVAAGDLGVFAVGSEASADWDAAVWASGDGMTWERVVVPMSSDDPGPFDAGQMRAVLVSDARVVAVGTLAWGMGQVTAGEPIGFGEELDAVGWVGLPAGTG